MGLGDRYGVNHKIIESGLTYFVVKSDGYGVMAG